MTLYFDLNAGKKPTLRELQLLRDNDGRQVRVIDTVAPCWQELAVALGFDGAAIEVIDRGDFYRPEDACRKMFIRWQNGEQGLRRPITWTTLIECLQEVTKLGDFHETVMNCLCNMST